jgi:hypothetical protein
VLLPPIWAFKINFLINQGVDYGGCAAYGAYFHVLSEHRDCGSNPPLSIDVCGSFVFSLLYMRSGPVGLSLVEGVLSSVQKGSVS